MQDIRIRMQELIAKLDEAAKAYYKEDKEIISNLEYDTLYDELEALEKSSGLIMSASPTRKVGYEVAEFLPKMQHESPMLSLDKTKEVEELRSWLLDKEAVLSWKLDGLTVVLKYKSGELASAVTRGNGIEGELITENAKAFVNIPLKIAYEKELTIRGEAVISYKDFEKINAGIEDVEAKYKNPRNLCSGSVRQLNPLITKSRYVRFIAFNLMDSREDELPGLLSERYEFLRDLGFDVADYKRVNAANIEEAVAEFSEEVKTYALPSDGLVLSFDDIAYGRSLGSTEKFPRNAIAFKWTDELAVTTLKEIEWSASRTGLINPIAVFEPVELEGTTVSRASVHNLSMLESLELGIGDSISVYKANMIIPQIAENFTKSGSCKAPQHCPVCHEATVIKQEDKVRTVHCINPDCPIKKLKNFVLAVSRDALNIDGLSEMTLEKFIANSYLEELSDLYRLDRYKEEITSLEGFGKRSYEKLIKAVDKSRDTTLPKILYSLGISGIGAANAKMISKHYDYDIERVKQATLEELKAIEGIGEVLAASIAAYFADKANIAKLDNLLSQLKIDIPAKIAADTAIAGKTFVVTGKVESFASRKELGEYIESLGGKMASSISSQTDYLINNDSASGSSKNKKAKELGVSIITETEFRNLVEN